MVNAIDHSRINAQLTGGPFDGQSRGTPADWTEIKLPYDDEYLRLSTIPDSNVRAEQIAHYVAPQDAPWLAVYVKGDEVPERGSVDMRLHPEYYFVFDPNRSRTPNDTNPIPG